jgi:sulfate transport system permease protein
VSTIVLAPRPARKRRRRTIAGGVGPIGLGVATLWLSVIVLLPLAAVFAKALENGPSGLWDAATAGPARAAFILTVAISVLVALVNVVVGTLIAWVLVRDDFRGKGIVNAIIDLPFALPTIVASIVLLSLYGPRSPIGLDLYATRPALIIALAFVTLPFVVRSVQPVLQELDADVEEAAETLGATDFQRVTQVVLPAVYPALLTGVGLAFARAVGEYGSVIFIAGNMPLVSEIAPLLIVIKLEQYDYAGAAAVGLAMLAISFGALLIINAVQAWLTRRGQA